jgi:hypothetical protein
MGHAMMYPLWEFSAIIFDSIYTFPAIFVYTNPEYSLSINSAFIHYFSEELWIYAPLKGPAHRILPRICLGYIQASWGAVSIPI